MFGYRSDLPLTGDESSRFLPWLVALMVYLASLALAGAMVVGRAGDRWSDELAGNLTVQIPPEPGDIEAKLAKAADIVASTAGIERVEILGEDRIVKLLEPWLGTGELVAELSLPRLIDATIEPGVVIDIAALKARLGTEVPGATVDDHRQLLDRLLGLARSIEWLALAVVALIASAAALTVVFVTRTNLAIQSGVIEMLHLMGAQDSYVARQFERHALMSSLKGGALGAALAAGSVLAVGRFGGSLHSALVPDLSLDTVHWLTLLAVPAAASLIATITARLTALKTLERVP